MARFGVIAAVIAAAFMVYSVVDCAMTNRGRIRGPRKGVWILLILVLPVLGGVLWFLIGRGKQGRPAPRSVAPDDDPAFLRGLSRDADQEERIRRLERELADLDSDAPEPRLKDPDTDGEAPDRRDA